MPTPMDQNSELGKLMTLAGTMNINGEKLLDELANATRERIKFEFDSDAVLKQIKEVISVEITELLKTIQVKTGESEQQGLVAAIVKVLGPQLFQAQQKVADDIFRANFQATQTEIYRVIDQRMAQYTTPPGPNTEIIPHQPGQQVAAALPSLGTLTNLLLQNSDKIATIINAISSLVRPPAGPEVKALELFKMSMRLNNAIEQVKKGDNSALEQTFTEVLGQSKPANGIAGT